MPAMTYQNQAFCVHSNHQSGFTLVELMVVVVILALFAGMVTLSVSSSDVRKNRAFYEHLIDGLTYVRLISAERMQPMGLILQTNSSGQIEPQIVSLSNPYYAYQHGNDDQVAKNNMELSANIAEGLQHSANQDKQNKPSWQIEPSVDLPPLPADVTIQIASLEIPNNQSNDNLQPWFSGQNVPQVIWFGTGQATPVTIEIRYKERLVGDVIEVMPDGRIQTSTDEKRP